MPRRPAKPSTLNLKAVLEDRDTVALRIEIARGARAPIVNGQPTLQACWTAHLASVPLLGPRRVQWLCAPIVDQSPAALLRQLADIYEDGELKLHA